MNVIIVLVLAIIVAAMQVSALRIAAPAVMPKPGFIGQPTLCAFRCKAALRDCAATATSADAKVECLAKHSECKRPCGGIRPPVMPDRPYPVKPMPVDVPVPPLPVDMPVRPVPKPWLRPIRPMPMPMPMPISRPAVMPRDEDVEELSDAEALFLKDFFTGLKNQLVGSLQQGVTGFVNTQIGRLFDRVGSGISGSGNNPFGQIATGLIGGLRTGVEGAVNQGIGNLFGRIGGNSGSQQPQQPAEQPMEQPAEAPAQGGLFGLADSEDSANFAVKALSDAEVEAQLKWFRNLKKKASEWWNKNKGKVGEKAKEFINRAVDKEIDRLLNGRNGSAAPAPNAEAPAAPAVEAPVAEEQLMG